MNNVLTLSKLRKYCRRRSGRTSEIEKEIQRFMSSSKADSKSIVVLVHHHVIVDMYLRKFREIYFGLDHMFISNNNIKSKVTGRATYFITPDSVNRLRGIKFIEVFFDTPEYEAFQHSDVITELASIQWETQDDYISEDVNV